MAVGAAAIQEVAGRLGLAVAALGEATQQMARLEQSIQAAAEALGDTMLALAQPVGLAL